MTERTVRMTAKELCGAFYDDNRTARFRQENPSQDAYVARMWPHFVDLARESMAKLLALPGTSQHLKDAIEAALIEDNDRATRPSAKYVPQATLEPREKEDNKLIDSLVATQLPSSHNT